MKSPAVREIYLNFEAIFGATLKLPGSGPQCVKLHPHGLGRRDSWPTLTPCRSTEPRRLISLSNQRLRRSEATKLNIVSTVRCGKCW